MGRGRQRPKADGFFSVIAEGGAWDQAIARRLVRPLVRTPVTPNQLTTFRLLLGLAACALIASGDRALVDWGAGLFFASNLTDHADGELARLTGRTSRFGHYYDLTSDALVHTLVFAALGYGLRESSLGDAALWLGFLAGGGVTLLFWVFGHRFKLFGRGGVQPRFWGFDLEDVLYLAPPIIWLGWAVPFLVAAAAGAPLAAAFLFWQHRQTLFARASEGKSP